MPARLARADLEGVGRGEIEQAGAGEMVIDDDVAPAQDLGPAPGQESRVARPGPHQVDNASASIHERLLPGTTQPCHYPLLPARLK